MLGEARLGPAFDIPGWLGNTGTEDRIGSVSAEKCAGVSCQALSCMSVTSGASDSPENCIASPDAALRCIVERRSGRSVGFAVGRAEGTDG